MMIRIIKSVLLAVGLFIFLILISILFSIFKVLAILVSTLLAVGLFTIIIYNCLFKDDDD